MMEFDTLSFLTRHALGGAGGWYLYPIIAPIAFLWVSGIMGISKVRWGSSFAGLGLIFSLALINFYGVIVEMLPYYTGFTSSHLSRSRNFQILTSAPVENFSLLTQRLAMNKPPMFTAGFYQFSFIVFLLAVAASVLVPAWMIFHDDSARKSTTPI